MDHNSSQPIVVLMTAASHEEAGRIAEALIEDRLAACVQILPEIESVYRWKGKVTRDHELLLLAKSTAELFAGLERKVREIHSYETPEIVALNMVDISGPYRDWLITSLLTPES